VCLQHWHGWCHMKLQPSRHKFCVHHTTMHHVTPCKATNVRLCVFSCNLPPALLAEWPGSFTCYFGNTEWNEYRNKSQRRKSTLVKKFSRRSCTDANPRPFNHGSGILTTELSPSGGFPSRFDVFSRCERRYPYVKGCNSGAFQTFSWEQLVTCLAHSKEPFKTSLAEYWW